MAARTGVVAVVIAAMTVGSLGWGAPVARAQEEGAGIVDDQTYVSPLYGYEVTWGAPWAADSRQTRSDVGASASDLLTLGEVGGDGALRVEGYGDDSEGGDPLADRDDVEALLAAFVDAFETTCEAGGCEVRIVATEADGSPPTITYDLTVPAGTVRGITSLVTDETEAGWIVFAETVLARPGQLAATLADVQGSIVVAGRPAMERVELAEGVGTPIASPAAEVGAAGGWLGRGAAVRR